jgi:hypothetical protein
MITEESIGNQPSLALDYANKGTLLGSFNFAIDKIIQGLDNRLPASIVSYDRATNLAQIQILIPMVTTDGSVVSRSQVASVPVQMDGGGGVVISFPLVAGDMGWIEACDRDISLFLQTLEVTKPNTLRKWSFSDAKFTPNNFKALVVNIIDHDAAVISTLDGMIRISISPTLGVSITSPTVTINGGLTLTGNMTGPDGSGGTLTLTGSLVVTEKFTCGNGTLTTQLQVNGNGVASGTFSPT